MLTGIVFDALDVAVMERFWLAATAGRTGGLQLRFEATDKPKTDKNRLHLDLAGGPDWEAEVERLLDLGAVRIDIGQGDVPWDVLADPEGNEFCVLRPGQPGVLVDGGLAAICLDMAEEDRHAQPAFWQAVTGWEHAEHHKWGVLLRRTATSPVALVMGRPPRRRRGATGCASTYSTATARAANTSIPVGTSSVSMPCNRRWASPTWPGISP